MFLRTNDIWCPFGLFAIAKFAMFAKFAKFAWFIWFACAMNILSVQSGIFMSWLFCQIFAYYFKPIIILWFICVLACISSIFLPYNYFSYINTLLIIRHMLCHTLEEFFKEIKSNFFKKKVDFNLFTNSVTTCRRRARDPLEASATSTSWIGSLHLSSFHCLC